jgi:serine/threonine-protein kinase
MDDRNPRRLELVKKDEPAVASGVITSKAEPMPQETGIQTGTVLEGKYLVGRVVGTGAVGIVYEAKNVELDETVAIKCLRPEMMAEPSIVGRFAREAKASAGLKSEYVATVFDVGTTPTGAPYIVMEYLDGKDLGTVVAEGGSIGPRTAVEYALHVCEALAVAHAKGIVHRDIKPENLHLTERAGGIKIVKVLDFGISKAALTGSIFKNAVPLVKTVNLMGTPLYMSPEQVRVTDSVDVRSDIWSLGMVIYEMLTGQTAFDGQSITEICAQILEATPRPIEMYRNDLPSGLVEVIHRCLTKDVNKRYQNVAELALALMPFGPKRTRLNVERAVAVLQAAGHLSASVTVNSTMPPSPTDFLYTPIPGSGRLPSDLAPPSSSSVPISPPSSSSSMLGQTQQSPHNTQPSQAFQVPEKKKSSFGLILGVLAVAAVLAGIGVAIATKKADATPAPEKTAQVKDVKPTAPPPATQTATATPQQEAATAETTAAPGTATHAVGIPAKPARPAWMSATPPAQPRTPASTKKTGTKAPGSAEEPDLGY